MKVLAYLHTYNDADVIDATLRALEAQSYPIPEILLIDNASSDGTIDRAFPDKVTVLRNQENLGTSGAVERGMRYAIERGYDWIYILDADSKPEPDAIANLVRSYQDLSPELQASTWWLSSLLIEPANDHVHHGCVFTAGGVEQLQPPPEPTRYACDLNMWSGSFYRLDAVREVGLPDPDYVLDWGDVIYGYEGHVRGYTGFVEQSSVVLHNLHPIDTLRYLRVASRHVKVFYSPPPRFYYLWRNTTYFWLSRYEGRIFPVIIGKHLLQYLKWMIKATLFIKGPWPILRACLIGLADGLGGRLDRRYR